MGIRPNRGDKVETNYRIDGSTEAQQLITDVEHTGQEAGKVFAEISAQADSANKGTTELASRVKNLEGKIDTLTNADTRKEVTNGRLSAHRAGPIVIVNSAGSISAQELLAWQLPDWAKPIVTVSCVPVNAQGGQIYIGVDGRFTLSGLSEKNFRFTSTYISAA
ncbi:hypothetical protein [Corynebacterium sp. LaCa116]|uniref:hypothetical protein n=1 Tax=Corynebacterium sp. LaCa116 TaxID=3391423 RepID=UPI003989B077